MKVVLVTQMVAALLFFGLSANAADEPFELRGVRLGITLDEFRKAQYPSPDSEMVSPYCHTDPQAKRAADRDAQHLSDEERALGVLKCTWYLKDGSRSVVFEIAGVTAKAYYYFVSPQPNEKPILYLIEVEGTNKETAIIYKALSGKYGEPLDQVQEQVVNRSGVPVLR